MPSPLKGQVTVTVVFVFCVPRAAGDNSVYFLNKNIRVLLPNVASLLRIPSLGGEERFS